MADPYKAEDTQLAVGLETDQGDSVEPTQVFGKVVEDATMPDPEQEWIVQRVIGGDREPFQQEQGIREMQGGEIPIVLQDGHPVAYALGADSVSGSSSPYEHTITPRMDGKPPSQTIEAVYYGRGGGDDFVRTFAGGVPESLELSMNEDDELTASLSYWAMGVETGTDPTSGISVPDTDPWLFADASSQLSLFGTDFARFIDFSVSVENNLEEGRYIVPEDDMPTGNSRDPYEITYGNVDYEISATIVIEDDDLYQELVDPSTGGFDADIAFERGSDDYKFEISGTGCQFTEAPHEIPGESGRIEVEVTMQPTSMEFLVESDEEDAFV